MANAPDEIENEASVTSRTVVGSSGGRATVTPDLTQSVKAARRGRWWRRVAVLAVGLFVLAGLVNVWGPRSGIAASSGDHHQIAVSSPTVSRGGLAATWRLTVRRIDGEPLTRQVLVEVDQAYLDLFDQHALDPTPDESWTDGRTTHWRFRVPPGVPEFVVSLDGRIQPDVRWRHRGTTTVHVGDDTIAVHFTTWLLP